MNYQEFPEGYFGDKKPDALSTPDELLKTLSKHKKYLVSYIKTLPQNAKVLDAGCGSGKTIKMIRVFRPDVQIYGTDISDVSAYLPKGVDFKKGSVEDLPNLYKESFFDAVICQHVIEHLYSPIPMISAFQKILKPGGSTFIETPNWTRLFVPFSHFFFWNDYTHVRIYTRFSMTKPFSEYAFEVDKIITVGSCRLFPRHTPKSTETNAKQDLKSLSKKNDPHIQQGVFFRILARIINPIMKDVLIGIAINRK